MYTEAFLRTFVLFVQPGQCCAGIPDQFALQGSRKEDNFGGKNPEIKKLVQAWLLWHQRAYFHGQATFYRKVVKCKCLSLLSRIKTTKTNKR